MATRHRQLTDKQVKQEEQYAFPYHYIAQCENGNFSQTINLPWGYEYLSYLSFILERLSSRTFESLLDVGCGDGRFLFEVRKNFPTKHLIGVDISERAVNLATIMNPTVHYVVGDITEKILTAQFDVITAIEVLEHIPPLRLRSFIEALHYLLKDSGILIITVPSTNVRVRAKHYQHFNLTTLNQVLQGYFEIGEFYFLNKGSFRKKIISNFLSNSVFILNARSILNKIYHYYRREMLIAQETNAQRVCVICKKNERT